MSDLAAKAAKCIADPMQCRLDGERDTFKMYGFPDGFVDWYQGQRSLLGIEPPTVTGMLLLAGAIPLMLFVGGKYLLGFIFGMIGLFFMGVTGKLTSDFAKFGFILACLFFLLIILLVLFFLYAPVNSIKSNLLGTQKSIGAIYIGFQNQAKPVPESSYKLLNIQPLAVKQIGFIGPEENDGIFEPSVGIQTAVRSGASFFTLQIDYLEREQDSKSFDDINVPTLLYRNSAGHLISKNGASINEVAKQLANYAFSPDLGASKYPIIVYLHFVKTPDPMKKPTEYLNFLMKVSEALQPIHPHILKDVGENFRRQKSEGSLLQLPLTSISNTIILMCNADTTIFRNSQATGKSINSISDLDSFINMRVYLENEYDRIGVTQPVTDAKANAVILSYSRLSTMSDSERQNFIMKGKNRFVIAMPAPLDNPTYADLKTILKDTGVNAIPLNLMGTDPEPINKIISLWTAFRPYYMLKQMMLQSYTTPVAPNGS